jgi:hypothetical protein
MWEKIFRCSGLNHRPLFHSLSLYFPLYPQSAAQFLLLLLLVAAPLPAHGRQKKDVVQYGEGLIVNVPLPEPEVALVVEEVSQNTIIRGTKEYNKDEYVAGAVAATSTPVFPPWNEGGKVFYKVRKQALDPRNFKDSADVGTLAVRYVVQPQGEKNTVVRIDAVFVEDFRHSVHPSNGSVESNEYKDIQDRLASIELVKKETDEALEAKQARLAKQKSDLGDDGDGEKGKVVLSTPPANSASTEGSDNEASHRSSSTVLARSSPHSFTTPQPSPTQPALPPPTSPRPASYDQSAEPLEQHVAELRRQVERLVMKPGAPLKSAPFHTASTLKSLPPGAEVLILISTPYWYGVETHDGEHGWIRRDQLEQLP